MPASSIAMPEESRSIDNPLSFAAALVYRYFIPTLATMAAIAAAYYFVFAINGYQRFFADSDAGRHLRIGQWILTHHQIPRVDIDTFTYFGHRWYDWEWLADAFSAFIYGGAGLQGIVLLYGTAIGVCVYLSVRLTWMLGGSLLLVLLSAPFAIQIVAIHTLARPHVFSWVLLLLVVLFFERLDETLSWRDACFIVAVNIIWANSHASFFLGAVVAIAYTTARLVSPYVWTSAPGRPMRPFLVATALTLAAGFLNPYGWDLHRHVFDFLTNSEMTNKVSEYQSFNFRTQGATAVTLALALTVAGVTLSVMQRRLDRALLMLLFCWQALSTVRMLPMLVLVALPMANAALTQQLQIADGITKPVRAWLQKAARFGNGMREADCRAGGWCFVLIVLFFAAWRLNQQPIASRTGFPADLYPVQAADAIAKLPPTSRLFSTDAYGSYLTYRFDGNRKVFIDGRTDLYDNSFFNNYGKIINLEAGWESIWNEQHLSHALLPSRSRLLLAALRNKGWQTLYRDKTATLLIAPQDTHYAVNHQQ